MTHQHTWTLIGRGGTGGGASRRTIEEVYRCTCRAEKIITVREASGRYTDRNPDRRARSHPEGEIVVTEEMKRAGSRIMGSVNNHTLLATEIYRAMVRASRG